MKRQTYLCGAAALLLAILPAVVGHGDQPKQTAAFMRLKLDHSQHLLEGLALNDLNLVAKHAEKLSSLSLDEEWQVFETPQYLQHSLDFRRAADAVAAAAQKKNLDGAVLAYMALTMQCVECHKHVRDVRMASLPGDDAAGLAKLLK